MKEGYYPVTDLVKTVNLVAVDFPKILGDPKDALGTDICHLIERNAKKKHYAELQKYVKIFNERISHLRTSNAFELPEYKNRRLTYNQTVTLLDQIYARVVTDVDTLRQYRGFSKEVYGETRHPIIHDIIKKLQIHSGQIFVDLGSGIGNVVLQVAAQTGCRAYGMELLEIPSQFARLQLLEYKARLSMLSRAPGVVHLKRGDFLEDAKVHKVIERADVVFVNNYAFGSTINHRLMQLFLSMKEGATIVCFEAFRTLEHTITEHNMNNIASILTVEKQRCEFLQAINSPHRFGRSWELKCSCACRYASGGVSWTASPGEYFIHRIDRRSIKIFLNQLSSSRRPRSLGH